MTLAGFDDNLVASHGIFAHDPAAQSVFAPLRRDDPLHYTRAEGYPPFWAVTTQRDIADIGRHNEVFLNAPMSFLPSIQELETRRRETGGGSNYVRALTHMDAPDHRLYRGITQSWFMPANIKRLEATVDAVVKKTLDRMEGMNGECDFANDVAPWLPLQVIMEILGVEEEHHPMLLTLTQQLLAPQDAHQKRGGSSSSKSLAAQVFDDYYSFFRGVVADRRAHPKDDLASVISNMRIRDAEAPELETLSYFVTLATAGHDTTFATLAGGLLELMRHPDQMQRLRSDPALANSAAEEMFRWVSPIKHFVRTANSDFTLSGKEIRNGDHLMLCYPSANRDEAIFEDPDEFRIDRTPNRHMAFGSGIHSCLGQHLARMEVRAFFKEFVRRVDTVELTGAFEYVNSNRASGPKFMPIRYTCF